MAAIVATPIAAQNRAGSVDGLVLVRRVRVVESDTLFLSRPTEIALSGDGHVFVTESEEGHVLDLAPDGRIVRVFGRKGRGPGELMNPSTLTVGGDSILFVFDRGQRRLAAFSLRTGQPAFTTTLMSGWPPAMRVVGKDLLVTAFDTNGRTSLATLDPGGRLLNAQGVIPAAGMKYPMLLHGGFSAATFDVSGDDVYAMFELSPSLYRWKRGSRTASEITVPKVWRLGVDPSLFDRLLADPNNTERVRALIYSRSIPAVLEVVAARVIAIVTLDYTPGEHSRTFAFYATIMDLNRGASCVDLTVPLARATIGTRDGIPRVAVRGNNLAVLEQGLDARGESAPTVTWYRLDPSRCS